MRLFGTIDNIISSSEKTNIVLPPFNLLSGGCSLTSVAKVTASGSIFSSANFKSTSSIIAKSKINWEAVSSISAQSKTTTSAKVLKKCASSITSVSSLSAVAKTNHPVVALIKNTSVLSATGKEFYKSTSGIKSTAVVFAPAKKNILNPLSVKSIVVITARSKMTWKSVLSFKGVALLTAAPKFGFQSTASIKSTSVIAASGSVAASGVVLAFCNIKSIGKITAIGNPKWNAVSSIVSNGKITAPANISGVNFAANLNSISKINLLSNKVARFGVVPPIKVVSLLSATAKCDRKSNLAIRSTVSIVAATEGVWLSSGSLKGTTKVTAFAKVNRLVDSMQIYSNASMTLVPQKTFFGNVSIRGNNALTATCKYFIRSPGVLIQLNSNLTARAKPIGKGVIIAVSAVTASCKKKFFVNLPTLTAISKADAIAKINRKGVVGFRGNTSLTAVAKIGANQTIAMESNSNFTSYAFAGVYSVIKSTSKITIVYKMHYNAEVSIQGNSNLSANAQVDKKVAANLSSGSVVTSPARLNIMIPEGLSSFVFRSSVSLSATAVSGNVFANLSGRCRVGALIGSFAYADLKATASVSAGGVRFATKRFITDGNQIYCNPCASTAFTFKRDGKRYIKNVIKGALAPTLHHQGISHEISD